MWENESSTYSKHHAMKSAKEAKDNAPRIFNMCVWWKQIVYVTLQPSLADIEQQI
jgi:hypothetical protein